MVAPIGSLEELWNWDPVSLEIIRVNKLVNYRDNLAEGKPETMICHDMKGGYLEEESDDGTLISEGSPNPYVFLNWWNIDIFCYFSHNFVTIPPTAYISLAHSHGCLALGTFITEWKGGAKLCDHFLETEESVKKTVDRLVAVARYFNFDGWLINIENRIRSELLRNLELFLRLLTDNMRKSAEFSRVIWYDSVTATGNLKWQNMLNGSNLRWYNSCDGIYLNYNWDDAMLLQSADFGVISRIFVGIDCFARGCIGGWNCSRSFAKANLMRMSVALFAPGWICEQFPHANPIENGLKFWKKLALFTPARPILELPISTDFCAGFTQDKDGMRFRLGSISLQPHYIGHSQQITPNKHGGLLLPKGCSRLFNFDVDCRACRITIQAQREVKILVNGVVKESKKEGEQIMVVIDEPIHLVSLDVCVDDFKECSLHRACIEEL